MDQKLRHCACTTTKGAPCRQPGTYLLADGRVICARHWAMLRQGHTLVFRAGGATK